MSGKVEVETETVPEMLYLYIKEKDADKVRSWKTMSSCPDIPEGRYAIKKEDGTVTIHKVTGKSKKKDVKTVKVGGVTYISKAGKEGELILTPAPNADTFSIEKNKEGKLDLRVARNSVRTYIQVHEDNGIYGVFHNNGALTVERLR